MGFKRICTDLMFRELNRAWTYNHNNVLGNCCIAAKFRVLAKRMK